MGDFFDGLYDTITNILLDLFEAFLGGLLDAFFYIPCLPSLPDLTVPPMVAFILSRLGFDYALYVFVCAYAIRFLIRRLPFIG